MILGLDVSTSITGATVIDKDGKVVYTTAWDTRNKKHFPTLISKATWIEERLIDIGKKYKIKEIYIEKPLQFLSSGNSTAKTLSILYGFNGILSWICYQVFHREPYYLGANTARKACSIVVPRGTKAKEAVLKYVLDNDPSFEVEYTRHGNPKPGTYDRADSIVIAKAGYIEWKQRNLKS
jgi:Holliday junction resolvasome RuvABC endonuclease subunit